MIFPFDKDMCIQSIETSYNVRSVMYFPWKIKSLYLYREAKEAEIYDFETQQINLAHQAMVRNAGEKQKALAREREAEERWSIIIGSAVVTSATSATIFTNFITISYALKGFSAFCSLIITIAASFMGYFKYRERSNNLQKAADDIENDYEAVKLGTHIYFGKPREEAIDIFVDRVLKRIKEQKDEQQILEQPPDVKQPPTSQ